jgi:nucleotide-binding universal stress UspA family protein
MLPFRKILFPTDFSERCRAVAPAVAHTVERFGAELILLNAIDPAPLMTGALEPSLVSPVPDFLEQRRRQEHQLGEFQREFFATAHTTLAVEDGDPAWAVRQFVRHHAVDLVMLPTHGRGAFRRLLLGSVTTKILHDVDCAVWTDAHRTEGNPGFPYRRILCCLDVHEAEAAAVLRAACSLASTYDAELALVHVVETPPASWEVDYVVYRDQMIETANKKMGQLMEDSGIQAPFEIGSGGRSEEVHRVAVARGADLIVTGRGHARSGVGRLWSSLYSIIREAPCPVLSI